jgi:hypothetical protein
MGKRILLAGVLGGVGMFVWSSIAHMALPLGDAGIQEISNEQTLLGPMRATLGEKPGMFLFPAMSRGANQKPDMQEYDRKLAANPSGILIYHPPGAKGISAGMLITEFLTEVFEALVAAFLLAQCRLRSFVARWAFVVAIGVIAATATNIPYWNWYGFPGAYTAAYMTIQIAGFAVVGAIAAAVLKPAPQAITARA